MNFSKKIQVGARSISKDSPTFVIAEAGVNHGGDMGVAKQLIDKAENLILSNIQKAPYQKNTTDACETQFDMLKSYTSVYN